MADTTYQPLIWREQGGSKMHFDDSALLYFGNDNDVSLTWNGTNLVMLPVADDTGAFHIGDGTTDFDVKIFLGASTKYVLFDVGNSRFSLEDVDFLFGDNDSLAFGDGSDVALVWDGTNFTVIPATNDTGAFIIGNGTKDMDLKVFLGSTTEYAEFDVGNSRVRLNVPLYLDNNSGAWNSALLMGAGTGADPATTASADKNFFEFRTESTATSGDARGIYNRLYLSGAGGSGESLRAFTTVNGVAGANAHGAHISLNFAAVGSPAVTGSLTGQGIAGRNTIHVPNSAMSNGTFAALQAEVWSDGSSSDMSGVTEFSFLRFVNGGDATGLAVVDDNAFLMSLSGGAVASGNIMAAKTASAVSHGLRMKGPDGNTYYIMVSDTQ